MLAQIALAIFVISLGGILFFLIKKASVLRALPKNSKRVFKSIKLVSVIDSKVQNLLAFFFDGVLLHKFLSWAKCRIIQIETWIDALLHGLRKKNKENKLNKKK